MKNQENPSRIVYIHWNAAEAELRADRLRADGYVVDIQSSPSGEAMRAYRLDPPDAFVIDLSRIPSNGQAVAIALRQGKTTRTVPILFTGGQPDKVERVRGLLPDAVYTSPDELLPALQQALANPPQNPIVPGTMDGYSGTPLVRKLGIRGGARLALIGAPVGFAGQLGDLPAGARLVHLTETLPEEDLPDVIVLYLTSRQALEEQFLPAASLLRPGGKLWIAWPKKTSGVQSDLSETYVRAYGLEHAWVDFKIAAIDATWSGLCFSKRKSKG